MEAKLRPELGKPKKSENSSTQQTLNEWEWEGESDGGERGRSLESSFQRVLLILLGKFMGSGIFPGMSRFMDHGYNRFLVVVAVPLVLSFVSIRYTVWTLLLRDEWVRTG